MFAIARRIPSPVSFWFERPEQEDQQAIGMPRSGPALAIAAENRFLPPHCQPGHLVSKAVRDVSVRILEALSIPRISDQPFVMLRQRDLGGF
jgi:hypothetical protein